MKRIEKDIKKKSAQLIESSLPEIDSLDNIPVKTKKAHSLPLFLVPAGLVTVAIVAIVVPLSLKHPLPIVQPSGSTNNSSVNGHSNNNSGLTSYRPPINTTHKYDYNLGGYIPALNSFNEFAYYSYIAYDSYDVAANNMLLSPKKIMETKADKDEEEVDNHTRYVDKYGRTHYPISLDGPATFSNFIFFEFDTTNNLFLEQRIGNGHIRGLAISTNIFDEDMLILKNGENYYSCLINGAGTYNHGNKAFMEFSAHKTIEGFDVVKDTTNKRYLTLLFDGEDERQIYYDQLSSINIEGETFNIDPSTVLYDDASVVCTVEGLREQFALDLDFRYVDEYGGGDELIYDANQTEAFTFTLEEFTGVFSVAGNALYLDETKILDLNGTSKIYASEINKDAHRELVFETFEKTKRMIEIFDVKNNVSLYRKAVSEINSIYDCYLDMMNERLVVKLFEPGETDESYLADYGYFGYRGKDGVSVLWQNLFELSSFRLSRVLEIDGETPVTSNDYYYVFESETPYIIEMKMTKYGSTNMPFPDEKHPIRCIRFNNIDNMPNQEPSWTLISANDGVYQYQIIFHESGYSYYNISFLHYSFELKAAVDVEFPQE